MKEKALVTSFALGNTVDIVITLSVLGLGLATEFNPLARRLMENGEMHHLLMVKISYTAVLIGVYALAVRRNSRLRYPTERALQITTVLLWAVQAWNLLNLGLALKA